MDGHGVLEVLAIAASDRDPQGKSHFPTELDDEGIASCETIERKAEAAERV